MITLFHSVVILIKELCRKFQKIEENRLFNVKVVFGLEILQYPRAAKYSGKNYSLKFVESMQHLRYKTVKDVLKYKLWRSKMHKIVDFGSASLDVARSFCKLSFPSEFIYVEIDEKILDKNVYKIQSYPMDNINFNFHCHPRKATAYHGSVYYPDEIFLNIDCVTAIELIEHLYPDVLEGFVYNIFGYMKAKLVIITTPNADFNVLFTDFTGFRHDDHKFEWTREEFTSWALNVTHRYPEYEVVVYGIGQGPEGVERFGHCSQIAVFARKEIIYEDYISKEEQCNCQSDSPCKIDNDEKKLLCKCLCTKCCPKLSYGICTHCTLSRYLEKNEDGSYYTTKKCSDLPFSPRPESERERIMELIKNSRTFQEGNSVECLNDFNYTDFRNVLRSEELSDVFLHFGYEVVDSYNSSTKKIEPHVIIPIPDPKSDADSNFDMTNDYNRWEFENCSWDENADDNGEFRDNQNEEIDINNTDLEINNKENALVDSGYHKSFQSPTESCDLVLSEEQSSTFNYPQFPEEKLFLNESTSANNTVAGPSNNFIRTIEDECKLFDEVKSITDCIIENSLNKIELSEDDDNDKNKADVVLNDLIVPVPNEPVVVVENGDLANNNRDLEGNNYPPEEEALPVIDNNLQFDNGNNELRIDNNNENYEEIFEMAPEELIAEPEIEDDNQLIEDEIARLSREAIFDPNSQIDLLGNFEMAYNVPNQDMLVIHLNPEAINVPHENNSFPNWLLQILEDDNNEEVNDDDNEDVVDEEPHFYCQGDGLGIHPSVITIEEEEDDDDTEASVTSSTSSSNDTIENVVQETVQNLVTSLEVINNDERMLQSENDEEFFDANDARD